jgi:hypothetical protein
MPTYAEAVAVHGGLGGGNDLFIVGKAEVIVGAEIQNLAPARHTDVGGLWREDFALVLPQRLGADVIEFACECGENSAHGSLRYCSIAIGGGGGRLKNLMLQTRVFEARIPQRQPASARLDCWHKEPHHDPAFQSRHRAETRFRL